MNETFEPKILAFLCNWCSYAGADSAGGQHRPVPANLKVVRVMCSGRVDPQFVLKAFKEGADGVMVLGCHPGDCHYKEGNYKALRRMKLMEKMLFQFGIEKERFRLDWVSASEGEKFSRVTVAMVDDVRKLGPLRLDGREQAEMAAAAAPGAEARPPEKPAPEKPVQEKPVQEKPAEISSKFDELLKDLHTS